MIYPLIRPLLFRLDPETAHRASIIALASGILPRAPAADTRLARRVMGLDFPTPVGLAAGFDKNAEVPDAILGLGFGFVEIGTVTPRLQAGNPKPRVFRLVDDRALINRLGFNSGGHDAAYARLARRKRNGIVGVNIGANKDSADRIADYVAGVRRFTDVADYLTLNISSPNTPGLRDLQEKDALARLLGEVVAARAAQSKGLPILLKIAPDLDDGALTAITETALSAGIDGMIVSNTTVSRDALRPDASAKEAGGVSGRPLFAHSTAMLAKVRALVGQKLVLVGAGGIDSAETARAKLAAGADLVQLYTGMIYEGPGLPARINAGLAAQL